MGPENDNKHPKKNHSHAREKPQEKKSPPRPDHDPKMRAFFVGEEEKREDSELVESESRKETSGAG